MTQYGYDVDGRQISMTLLAVPTYDPATGTMHPMDLTTTYQYNADGQQSVVTDPLGHKTAYQYDADGHVTLTTYDDGSFVKDTYDDLGRKTAESQQAAAGTPDDKLVWTYYQYNTAGNLTEVDPPAVPNPNDLDAQGIPKLDVPVTKYTYDPYGNELTQTDANGHTTRFTYDPFGNQVSRTLPDNEVEKFTYNTFGQEATHQDFNGTVATYTYLLATDSHAGMLSTVNYVDAAGSNHELVSYSYDDLGRPSTSSDANGSTTDTYDLDGNLIEQDTPAGTIHYAYDPATGRKVRMWTGSSADGSTAQDDTAYAYDSLGRLTAVYTLVLDGTRYATYTGIDPATHNPTFTGSPLITSYAYDAAGNLKTESQPDQTITAYSYDDLNRLTDQVTTNTTTSTAVFAEHYDYDLSGDGLRQDVIDTRYNTDGSVFSQTTVNWTYDNDGRLTSEALTVQAGGSNAPAPYTDSFQFDLAGNRAEEDILDGSETQTATVKYQYTPDNQLWDETRTGVGAYEILYGHYDANNVFHLGYDADGNLIEQHRTGTNPEDDSYTRDLRGRMSSATVNGQTTGYTYDTDGVRVSETSGGSTTFYLNDASNPTGYAKAVEEWVSTDGTLAHATLHRSYVLGLQVEAQADATHGVLFLLHDGHGNTRALLNASGGVVEQYNLDAYGNLLASTGAQASVANALTPWLQPDGLYDPASGWNYNLARWRDGFHYASMDDPNFIGGPGNLANANQYLYAGSDPANNWDPSGHDFSLVVGALSYAADFSRYALDPGRNFQASLGEGRALTSAIDFGVNDPFALADIAELPAQLQLQDVAAEANRGLAAVGRSVALTWEMIGATWDANEAILVDLVASFAFAQACFAAGTPVVVGTNPDGSYATKPIEQVRPGDHVLARDEHNEQADSRLQRVEEVFSREADHLRVLTVRGERGPQATIRTTDGHLIWAAGRGWTKAAKLQAGDRLCDARGKESVLVLSSEREELIEPVRVYTFRVQADHTYFVSDGVGTGHLTAWVHNVCSGAQGLDDALDEEGGLNLNSDTESKQAVDEALENGELREVPPNEIGMGGAGGRLGSPEVRMQNAEIAAVAEKRGWKLQSGGGGPEKLIPGPGGTAKGGAYADIVLTKNGRTLRINTVSTLADGVTPNAEEAANAAKIRQLRPNDHLLLIPKR